MTQEYKKNWIKGASINNKLLKVIQDLTLEFIARRNLSKCLKKNPTEKFEGLQVNKGKYWGLKEALSQQ